MSATFHDFKNVPWKRFHQIHEPLDLAFSGRFSWHLLQKQTTRQDKVITLLEILPRRGPRAFRKFVGILRGDYSWISEKLEQEYQVQDCKLADLSALYHSLIQDCKLGVPFVSSIPFSYI